MGGEDYGSVHMSIAKLIKSLRASFNDHESKERNTPMRDDLKSDLPDEEARKEKTLLLMQKRYGTFMFIAQTCGPDISYYDLCATGCAAADNLELWGSISYRGASVMGE